MLRRSLELFGPVCGIVVFFDKNESVMRVSCRSYCGMNKAPVAVGIRYGLPRASVG